MENKRKQVREGNKTQRRLIMKHLDMLLVKSSDFIDALRKRATPLVLLLAVVVAAGNVLNKSPDKDEHHVCDGCASTKEQVVIVIDDTECDKEHCTPEKLAIKKVNNIEDDKADIRVPRSNPPRNKKAEKKKDGVNVSVKRINLGHIQYYKYDDPIVS